MKWREGRQGTGYRVLTLWQKWFDLHIIHYPVGAHIPLHVDPVNGSEHHRVNIVLREALRGGIAYFDAIHVDRWCRSRIIKFRPDIVEHGVTKVREGSRIVLSIGWKQNAKSNS